MISIFWLDSASIELRVALFYCGISLLAIVFVEYILSLAPSVKTLSRTERVLTPLIMAILWPALMVMFIIIAIRVIAEELRRNQ